VIIASEVGTNEMQNTGFLVGNLDLFIHSKGALDMIFIIAPHVYKETFTS
jgi:hypothetical protein